MDNQNPHDVSHSVAGCPFAEPESRQGDSLRQSYLHFRARWNLIISVTCDSTANRLIVTSRMGIPNHLIRSWNLPRVVITDPLKDQDVVDVLTGLFLDTSNFAQANRGLTYPPSAAIRQLIVDTWHITISPYDVSQCAIGCNVISHKWETILLNLYGITSSEVVSYISGLCQTRPNDVCDSPLFTSFIGLSCSEIVDAITSCSVHSRKLQHMICHSTVSEILFRQATLTELQSVVALALNTLGARFKWPLLTFALRQKSVHALHDASEYEVARFFELYQRMSGTL